MANYSIGGEAVSVSLSNYTRLKRAWKYIAASQGATDFVAANDAMIGVIAVGLDTPFPGEPGAEASKDAIEAWRIAYIDDKLTVDEVTGLAALMGAILVDSGLSSTPPDTSGANGSEAALAA